MNNNYIISPVVPITETLAKFLTQHTKKCDLFLEHTSIMICFSASCFMATLVDTLKLFFSVVQDLLLALAVSVFCSITRWIPNMALGYQATVYTPLLSYNFLCIVMMFNSKWLHGSQPKLTTVSRTRRAWCMSGGGEASRLYLAAMFPSKRRVLGLDLTFLLDWKKWVWVSEFLREGGCCWCPEEGAGLRSAVAHCYVPSIGTVQEAWMTGWN